MDYLNPQKELRHHVVLFVGYGAIAIAVALTTLVLVYQAYGFGVAKEGTVTQSGLAYFSSQPNPANIKLNGVVNKSQTNARLTLPENTYQVDISRPGYYPWQRTIQVEGGSVRHYDYPFLIPKDVSTKKLAVFPKTPILASQSLGRRWLVVQQSSDTGTFDVYDLKSPAKAPTSTVLPDNIVTKPTSTQSWIALEWADDDNHLLLQHTYDDKTEFILLNRSNPEQSINVSTTVPGSYTAITLVNRKYDQYHLYNSQTKLLQSGSLATPQPQTLLQHVLSYKSYSDDTVLYATDDKAPKNKVQIKLRIGTKTTTLRTVPAGSTYLLNLTKYSDDLYVVLGASSENKLTVYKDPIGQLSDPAHHSLTPSQVLHVEAPDYVSFSSNAQFIVAEHATQFAVYDIENDRGHNYIARQPLDAPAIHASWMDGDRLTYVSGGQVQIFDYDYTNQHHVAPESSSFMPYFAPDYKFEYSVTSASDGTFALEQTSLLAPADR